MLCPPIVRAWGLVEMLARRCGNKDVETQVRPRGFYAEDSESEKYLQKTYAAKLVALTGFLTARCDTHRAVPALLSSCAQILGTGSRRSKTELAYVVLSLAL